MGRNSGGITSSGKGGSSGGSKGATEMDILQRW